MTKPCEICGSTTGAHLYEICILDGARKAIAMAREARRREQRLRSLRTAKRVAGTDRPPLGRVVSEPSDAFEEKVERLTKALQPFAGRAAHYDTDPHDALQLTDEYRVTVTLGELRAARAALDAEKQG